VISKKYNYHPKNVISKNAKAFHILLELLKGDLGDDNNYKVWRLLRKFPTNAETTQSIKDLKDLEDLFDVKHKYTLLYSLKILEGILLEDPKSINHFKSNMGLLQDKIKDENWALEFLKKGGLELLNQILVLLSNKDVKNNLDSDGINSVLCMITALRFLHQ